MRRYPLLLLHDGNISNRNQVRALAAGLNCASSVLELNALSSTVRADSCTNGIVIGCGRRVAGLVARMGLNGRNKTIQILHPRWIPVTTTFFDCLVLPHHDALGYFDRKDKVVRMHGALSYGLQKQALLSYATRWKFHQHRSQENPAFRLGVLMGGGGLAVEHFAMQMATLKQANVHVDIVASRRTPLALLDQLDSMAISVWSPHQPTRGPNPYRRILATSDAFLVASDSISMIADVISVVSERCLQSPIFLLPSSDSVRPKHVRFHKEVLERFSNVHAFIQVFEGADALLNRLEQKDGVITCQYEANRVAHLVKRILSIEE